MNYNINEEVWKDIKGFEGMYQVSNTGKVRSLDREITKPNRYGNIQNFKFKGRELQFNDNGNGYLSVQLGRKNRRYVHRLVAEAFIDNPFELPSINHIDNDRKNNNATNIEWVTQQENIQHKVNQDRQLKGETSPVSKLTEVEVLKIRTLLSKGIPQWRIGKLFGVKQSSISSIKTGKSWKHIK